MASGRGLQSLEELDPMERMRMRHNLEKPRPVHVSSLEEELQKMEQKVNYKEFEYVPVPRTEDD